MTKNQTLINERISMQEEMKKSERSIKIVEMVRKKGVSENMKPKKEEASAI